MATKARRYCLLLAAIVLITASSSETPNPPEGTEAIKVAFRRITESQYRHTITDLFGPAIEVKGRFEPELREGGLLAIGNAQLSLTTSGVERFFALGSSISNQVLGDEHRSDCVPCEPSNTTQADDACARKFIERYGERLFRRPLTESETLARITVASAGAQQAGDFYAGLKLALTSLLAAPEFLFRIETAEPDPANPSQYRLDGYTKAARLSYFFWDSAPDQELLEAASSGDIHTKAGIEKQIARLTSSTRFEDGARSFFADMLQLDGFEGLAKDPTIYPKFNTSVAVSAREQTLKTVIDLLIRKRQDYRDLFTSNETFINRALASVYQVPYASADDWAPYTFAESSERSGILSQISFLALFSHPGSSSPTKRGVGMYEIFMAESTPDPPADVDFSSVQATTAGTSRSRLIEHMNNQGCAACHRRTDPPGLALEHFDGLGQLRTMENGARIDVSAELYGDTFEGAQGLGEYLRDDSRVPASLVQRIYEYGTGRKIDYQDEDYLFSETKAFAANGYRVPDLMIRTASSPQFFRVVVPKEVEPESSIPPATTASLQKEQGVFQ